MTSMLPTTAPAPEDAAGAGVGFATATAGAAAAAAAADCGTGGKVQVGPAAVEHPTARRSHQDDGREGDRTAHDWVLTVVIRNTYCTKHIS